MLEDRVSFAEDWLGKVKADLAAGHRRDAFLHLATAQAELTLLTEQLASEMGIVPHSAPAPARAGLPLPLWGAAVATLLLALLVTLQPLTTKSGPVQTPISTEVAEVRPAFDAASHIDRMLAAARRTATMPLPAAEPIQLAQAPAPPAPRRRARPVPAVTALPVELTPEPVLVAPVTDPLPEPVAETPKSDLTLATLLIGRTVLARQ